MLQKLIVRNYAIIDKLTIEPDRHLNTVTGETGAGKSIILGALSLILGDRADTSVLINKEEKCVVEAWFDVKDNTAFRHALRLRDLDDEPVCIIRREISSSGKSRAFINDTPVNLAVLNSLTSLLVDLHQQFDHLALEDDHFQMDVVDALAQSMDIRSGYRKLFQQYRKTSQELAQAREQQLAFSKESDYRQFQLDELVQADFKEEEIEHAALQLKQMSHAEKIKSVLSTCRALLNDGEQPLVNELKRAGQQLQSITDVLPSAEPLQTRILSAYAELRDIADELETLEDNVLLDEEMMLQYQERLDLGYRLFKKHGVQITAELQEIRLRLEQELSATLNITETIEQLQQQLDIQYEALVKEAKKLTELRTRAAPDISKKITHLLGLTGMPNARFKITVLPSETPAATGMDKVQFLLDANKSEQFLPIHKAASGGEMSRIMLSIKSLTARAMDMPTLIFDEVDTGISGEAARQVGILLRDLGQYHQIICITHQPQVASKGERHYYVYKEAGKDQRITTQVRVLQPDERVLAIARMIGGEQPSDAALQNARELVAM